LGWQPRPGGEQLAQYPEKVLVVVVGCLDIRSDRGEGFGIGEIVEATADLPVIWRNLHITAYGLASIMSEAGGWSVFCLVGGGALG
jgi:hypothetical protein